MWASNVGHIGDTSDRAPPKLDREIRPFTGISRMPEEDSNPRHADYDSACPYRQSPVNTGDSGSGGGGWTQIWTHLSAGLHGVALLTILAVGRDR